MDTGTGEADTRNARTDTAKPGISLSAAFVRKTDEDTEKKQRAQLVQFPRFWERIETTENVETKTNELKIEPETNRLYFQMAGYR